MRRPLLATAAAFCATALAAPAAAQQPSAAAAAPSAAGRAEADALVRLLFPPQIADLQMPVARRAFLAGIAADPRAREVSAAYPGMADAAWEAVAPEIRAAFAARQPQLWERLSALYLARFAPAEIAALRRFFASPTGEKMLGTMYAQVDSDRMIRDMVARPGHDVSAATAARVAADTKAKTIATVSASLTDEDKAAYRRLGAAVGPERMHAVSNEAQQMTLAWGNERDPAIEARLTQIVTAAGTRYIATHKRAH